MESLIATLREQNHRMRDLLTSASQIIGALTTPTQWHELGSRWLADVRTLPPPPVSTVPTGARTAIAIVDEWGNVEGLLFVMVDLDAPLAEEQPPTDVYFDHGGSHYRLGLDVDGCSVGLEIRFAGDWHHHSAGTWDGAALELDTADAALVSAARRALARKLGGKH